MNRGITWNVALWSIGVGAAAGIMYNFGLAIAGKISALGKGGAS